MAEKPYQKTGKAPIDQVRFESESTVPFQKFTLSPTIQKLEFDLGRDTPISTFELARNILDLHPEYGGGIAGSIALGKDAGILPPRTVDEWIREISSLFDSSRVPVLDGRLMLVGLGLIDSSLRKALDQNGFWDAILSELTLPLKEILVEQEAGEPVGAPEDKATPLRGVRLPDEVKPQPDNPLENMDQDKLGRAAFAEYLARLISIVAEEKGSYAIHLYGPWGSGKTTLLNFLGKQLKEPKQGAISSKWVVVNFNAWRNQYSPVPWWSLLNNIYRECKGKLSISDRVRESLWRACTGKKGIYWGILILIVLGGGLYLLVPKLPDLSRPVGEMAKTIGIVISVGSLLAGLVRALAWIWAFGSAKSAQSYIDATTGPMRTIKKRFEKLVERIKPYRLAVLIDDLDRCSDQYVLKLLEGIQTLFRDAPVVFVVAADRRWLNACYESGYDYFRPLVHAEGKSLGTLFLEKTFQLSTPVPGVPSEIKERFWRHLLGIKEEVVEDEVKKASEKARQMLEAAKESGNVLNVLGEADKLNTLENQLLRQAVVLELATEKEMDYAEHALSRFVSLIDSNPRSMKRLVNAYNTYHAIAILSHVEISPDQLALWTILSLRWPILASALMDAVEEVNGDLTINTGKLGKECRQLLTSVDVKKILNGGPDFEALEVETVGKFSRLQY